MIQTKLNEPNSLQLEIDDLLQWLISTGFCVFTLCATRQMVLELVIRRVLELKHELVKWNPPNVDVRLPPPAPEEAFPWDYVNLDDILVDLKLSPDTLDIAVPR